jgi:iron(II)-dependent oxidoreductase
MAAVPALAVDWIGLLQDARQRTLEVTGDLRDDAPLLPIVNPPLWELGHVAWFQEKWMLRRGDEKSIHALADALWDSTAVAHDTRWLLPLPQREFTLRYAEDVLEAVCSKLAGKASGEDDYFAWLVTMHEDMHAEAFTYTRQTLAYAPPPSARRRDAAPGFRMPGDIEVPGGEYQLGAMARQRFVFDNEKWAHPVHIRPFRIARTPVTNAQYSEFVEAGGPKPIYWVKDSGSWFQRVFDATVQLDPDEPVIHVSWEEASAYCQWAGRRLPTEAEWELAAGTPAKLRFPWGTDPVSPERARLDGGGLARVHALAEGDSPYGCRQMIGNVWEWTASTFQPYPGFVADPYKEYSEPWFTPRHRVLRGGCWATRSRLIRNTWRNFFTADRNDIFAGFRTCALD